MNRDELMRKFPGASASTIRANCDDKDGRRAWPLSVQIAEPNERRIRQSQKPKMNKLESEWFACLQSSHWMENLRTQAKRYELGTGIWYKPDMTGNDTRDGRETCYEVKGPHAFRGGFENLKIAARVWPEVKWILVWKDSYEWKQQTILP